jgi:hypothetical protein
MCAKEVVDSLGMNSKASAVTGLVRLLVGWLEKLQNRNRFGALIGFQLVGFEAL